MRNARYNEARNQFEVTMIPDWDMKVAGKSTAEEASIEKMIREHIIKALGSSRSELRLPARPPALEEI